MVCFYFAFFTSACPWSPVLENNRFRGTFPDLANVSPIGWTEGLYVIVTYSEEAGEHDENIYVYEEQNISKLVKVLK